MNTTVESDLASAQPAAEKAPVTMRRIRLNWVHVGSYAVLLVLTVLYLGPLLMLLNTALKTLPQFMRDAAGLTATLHLQNFTDAWQKANFPKYMTNSLLYTILATLAYVITAVFVAFPLARRYVKAGNFLYTLFLIALFLPPALIPQFQLILRLGLYNKPLGYILLFLVNPIGIIILVSYIKTIPKELDEAAVIDGCGYFRFVIQILLPLIKPAIATVTVLHAIGIWNDYVLANIYLTSKALYPITRGLIVFQGIYGTNWPVIAAATLMLALPMMVLYLFLQRYVISGFTAGSVRG